MSEDKQSAHLVVCPDCGKEATIVFADGNQTESFKTKVDGKVALLQALGLGHIADEDVKMLEAQIDNSSLPFSEDSQEMPESTRRFRKERNRRRLFGGGHGGTS